MSHLEQIKYLKGVKGLMPDRFTGAVKVLDCGSLDVNGNCRFLFNSGAV